MATTYRIAVIGDWESVMGFRAIGLDTYPVTLSLIHISIGNALNFALNLLGCYVHDMRLQCLEFFGRFYSDGGKPFRPLAMENKYVDIHQ